MSHVLTMPKLQMSMTEGIVAQWLVADGASVEEGEPIYVLETEKAAQEIMAPASGKLIHKADEGQTYPVGAEIGAIEK